MGEMVSHLRWRNEIAEKRREGKEKSLKDGKCQKPVMQSEG